MKHHEHSPMEETELLTIQFYFEEEEPSDLPEEWLADIRLLFQGKKDELLLRNGPHSLNLLFVGLGKKEEMSLQRLRTATFHAVNLLKKNKVEEAGIRLPEDVSFDTIDMVRAVTEGAWQTEYQFDRYLSEKKEKPEFSFNILLEEDRLDEAERAITETEHLMEGVTLTRDLVNTPSNDMTPTDLAHSAAEVLRPLGVEVEIMEREQIEALGMKAFLAVANGSDEEPRFLVMKYTVDEHAPYLALVGKGLTYDSGGYAIKPAKSMFDMKSDMSGAASVIGAMFAIAKNKLQKNVVGVIASCENMVSGKAYRNGDIISSMKGTSIEVVNTDAEGRITLADSLYYTATQLHCEAIVDIATLTGACVVALGELTTGLITNDDALCERVLDASRKAGEYMWKLPVFEETREDVKGTVSDIKNAGSSYGGAITAGIFLEEFVESKPWVHLDIAGPAYSEKAYSYLPAGASGIPVKTLYQLVHDMQENK